MMKMKSLLARAGISTVAAVSTAAVSLQAHAAYTIPTAATDAFDDVLSAWTTFEAKIWLIAVPVTIGFIVLKLFKKGANKAT